MGACGMLIGVGVIVAKGCCSEPLTNEDKPLLSYDFLNLFYRCDMMSVGEEFTSLLCVISLAHFIG